MYFWVFFLSNLTSCVKISKNDDKHFFPQKSRKKKFKNSYRPPFWIFWAYIWWIIVFFSIESACKFAARSKFWPIIRRFFRWNAPLKDFWDLLRFILAFSGFIRIYWDLIGFIKIFDDLSCLQRFKKIIKIYKDFWDSRKIVLAFSGIYTDLWRFTEIWLDL